MKYYNFEKIGVRIRERRRQKGFNSVDAFRDAIIKKGYHVGRNRLLDIEKGCPNGFDISINLLSVMCDRDLLNCEIGYLLCEYDLPTGRNTDINKCTGLSNDAITTLEWLNGSRGVWGHKEIDIINFLLSQKSECAFLLSHIQDLFNIQYKIPVYHEKDGEKLKAIVPNNDMDVCKSPVSDDEIRFIHLAKSTNVPSDNMPLAITPDFLESVALMQIEKDLRKLRHSYKP